VFGLWIYICGMRIFFVIQVTLHVYKKKLTEMDIKETYWLTLTTKEELFERKGKLIYDPREEAAQNTETLISEENEEK
jgi:hypothetical protein